MKKSAPARHDVEQLRYKFEERRPLLEAAARNLELETGSLLHGVPHIDRIYFRVKSRESFVAKACQVDVRSNSLKYISPFDEIEDQVAGRILVFFDSDIEIASKKLVSRFNRVEAKRKQPSDPNTFDYESQHFVFTLPPEVQTDEWKCFDDLPTTFEMQVRTLFMHAWAEPQHDLEYKAKQDLTAQDRRELAWAAASAWGADQVLERVRRRVVGNEQTELEKGSKGG